MRKNLEQFERLLDGKTTIKKQYTVMRADITAKDKLQIVYVI